MTMSKRISTPSFTTTIFLIILSLNFTNCRSRQEHATVNEEDITDKSEEVDVSSEELDSDDLEAFLPTNEWQTVGENQAVPPGLHIRMNLATGHKEAKLLDPEDGGKNTEMMEIGGGGQTDDESMSVGRGQRQGIINTKRKAFTFEQAREALRKIKDESPSESDDGIMSLPPALPDRSRDRQQRLSVKEMEEVFEVLGLKMRSEVEIMAQHVGILADESSSDDDRLHALNELEYYVHQIDNARDLNIIGGLVLVVRCLNDSNVEIRRASAVVLGSAAQSNVRVQSECLAYQTLRLLLERLRVEADETTRKRVMFAVSSAVRQYQPAQEELLKLGGVDVLTRVLDSNECGQHVSCQKLSLKALTLVTDLLVEHSQMGVLTAKTKITSQFGLKLLHELVSSGWCSLVPQLLRPDDTDVSEKVLQAMQMLVHVCGNEFANADVVEQLTVIGRRWKGLAGDRDQYHKSLVELITQFLEQLVWCQESRDCVL